MFKLSARKKIKNRASLTKLVFPPYRFHNKLIKKKIGLKVSARASIYLTAVLEYMCAEILEIAGNRIDANKKKRISQRYIRYSIEDDEELNKLLSSQMNHLYGEDYYYYYMSEEELKKYNTTKKEVLNKEKVEQVNIEEAEKESEEEESEEEESEEEESEDESEEDDEYKSVESEEDINDIQSQEFGRAYNKLRNAIFETQNLIEVQNIIQKNEEILQYNFSCGYSVFHWACMKGNLEIVKFIAKHPLTPINLTDDERQGAIFPAVRSNHVDVVKFLCENIPNIDLNLRRRCGATILSTACFYGYIEIVEILLKHPLIDINLANPFESACQEGHFEIVKMLFFDERFDLKKQNKKKDFSYLHLSASKGHFEIVKFLCENTNFDVNE